MDGVIADIKSEAVRDCLSETLTFLDNDSVDRSSVLLTACALVRFGAAEVERPTPEASTELKEAVVRTGAYYFGPLFVLDKGTSIPSNEIFKELSRAGLFLSTLVMLNNAQLNLFFITLKSMGLVSDKHLIGYMKYSS